MALCDVSAPLEQKLEAIRNRTPDQRMAREGVPVFIGGKVFEVKPMVRAQARRFRERQVRAAAELQVKAQGDDVDSILAFYQLLDEEQIELIEIAIPELAGQREWLDENATHEELAEALTIATEFLNVDPNAMTARVTPAEATPEK